MKAKNLLALGLALVLLLAIAAPTIAQADGPFSGPHVVVVLDTDPDHNVDTQAAKAYLRSLGVTSGVVPVVLTPKTAWGVSGGWSGEPLSLKRATGWYFHPLNLVVITTQNGRARACETACYELSKYWQRWSGWSVNKTFDQIEANARSHYGCGYEIVVPQTH